MSRTSKSVSDLQAEIRRLTAENQRLRKLITRDALTGIPNRAALEHKLAELHSMMRREKGMEVSCLMIDVDYFRTINETRGHQGGDRVLTEVVGVLKSNLRSSDFLSRYEEETAEILSRYGGEEFCIFLMVSLEGAKLVAERLRSAVENRWKKPKNKVTISIGIDSTDTVVNPKTLIAHADDALYQAKKQGRNRVCVYG